MSVKLTYIYHSCFCLETSDATIIIDYYKDTNDVDGIVYNQVLPNAKKLYVLSTHSHADHFNQEVLTWKKKVSNITYILSKDILNTGMASKGDARYLDKLKTYKDENISIKAYGSTDIGGSFYIEFGGKKIFHAGDLNNWHWNEEANPEEVKESEEFYKKELTILAKDVRHLDIAMFPIDPRLGRDFMKGAKQFVETIDVNLLAPMHFGEEYQKVKSFEPIALKNGCKYFSLNSKGQSIIIK